MSNELFVIKYYDGVHGFYSELEKAKIILKKLYDEIPDYNDYHFFIDVYNLVDSTYINSQTSYFYKNDILVFYNKTVIKNK